MPCRVPGSAVGQLRGADTDEPTKEAAAPTLKLSGAAAFANSDQYRSFCLFYLTLTFLPAFFFVKIFLYFFT